MRASFLVLLVLVSNVGTFDCRQHHRGPATLLVSSVVTPLPSDTGDDSVDVCACSHDDVALAGAFAPLAVPRTVERCLAALNPPAASPGVMPEYHPPRFA